MKFFKRKQNLDGEVRQRTPQEILESLEKIRSKLIELRSLMEDEPRFREGLPDYGPLGAIASISRTIDSEMKDQWLKIYRDKMGE